MPSWSIHRFYAEKFAREQGIEYSCVGLIDRLVDDPGSALPLVLEEVRRSSKLLALMLYDEALRPEDPIAMHDWGTWRGFRASVDALRRVAEAVAGRTGLLMVDLHLSLDYVWKWGLDGYAAWAEELGIAEEVRNYVAREFTNCDSQKAFGVERKPSRG